MTNNFVDQLEEPHAVLWNRSATAVELRVAGEEAMAIASAINSSIALAPQRRTQGSAALLPPPPVKYGLDPVRPGLAKVLAAHRALADEDQVLRELRAVAVKLAAALAARLIEAEKADAGRDELRKPLCAQTERVEKLAKRFAEFPAIATRIVELFRDDILISKLGKIAYNLLPPPRGAYVSYERTWHDPRALANDEALAATKLPGHWPPLWRDYSVLKRPDFEEEDDEIIRPVRAFCRKGAASEIDVEIAVASAHAALHAEYSKAAGKIEDILRLDETVTPADRVLRYPDGGLVFDEAKFPSGWRLGAMRNFVKLPAIKHPPIAAE